MNNQQKEDTINEVFPVVDELNEIYGALNQMGALIEDLSRRLAELEQDKITATAKVSKIFLTN